MRIIQNGYNQKRDAYDQAEFLICTHNYHPLQQDSERAGARSPAALVSILLSMCSSNLRQVKFFYKVFCGIFNISFKFKSFLGWIVFPLFRVSFYLLD